MHGSRLSSNRYEALISQYPQSQFGVSLRGPYNGGPGSINVTITVGGMLVNPGDAVDGDSDGLVAFLAGSAAEVPAMAREKARQEQQTIAAICAGTCAAPLAVATINQKTSRT
ncbi:hypothetical protein [Ramlibacter sp. WS9]|uniref:RraA family protein n=1 Tax=Ramlibacter sp. WS9 TaxID=1882741 RepID=UPI001143CDEF|nr:hypothetical protein EEB15_06070 [Ramlibacter sp. WS9]